MKSNTLLNQKEIKTFFAHVSQQHQDAFTLLRETIIKHLPDGFVEQIDNNYLAYVVPHSIFPDGYHCHPETPLPFISIASQKNFIGFYHMGIYADTKLLDWFVGQYPKHCRYKLDIGKSCVRFKKVDSIPYDLIAELVQKMTPNDWVKQYQKAIKQ